MVTKFEYNRPEKPKNIKELPQYLKKLIGDFLFRLFYIFGIVWETSPLILIILTLIAVIQGFLPLIGAICSKNVINALQDSLNIKTDFIKIAMLLAAFFAYRFIDGLISRINTAIKNVAGELVVNTTKLRIIKKSQYIDMASFDMPEFYEKLENANREVSVRPINILSSTFAIVTTVITLISFIIVLSTISPWISVAMILLALPTAIVNFAYRKKMFFYYRERTKERRQMNYYSSIMLNKDLIKEIRLFGLATTFIERYKAVFKSYFKGLKSLIVKENIWHTVISVFSTIVNCCFFAFVAYKSFKGEIMIGDYTYYTGALTSISSAVGSLVSTTASVYEGTLFIDNIISFMKEKSHIVPLQEVPTPLTRGDHTIEFDNVSFKYPASDKYVLKNITTKINPGETVVLVGLNGAGKTTLIKLLTRLYDPTEGVIRLDGKDLREYEPSELYKIFGIIFQDFGKYAETVKDNISFGDVESQIDDEKIIEAAKSSNADQFIQKLAKKYETPLMRVFEQDGIELSIGQWQKLAISRAFYGDSDILILDEPTASLDAIAEHEIFTQFDKLRNNKITVFVSHRLSSATIANKIIVLENGMIVEEGNHKELMHKKGKYYKLFTTQAQHYIDEDINNL